MKLICYTIANAKLNIRTARRHREWMSRAADASAYRCLPLLIANDYGWEILSSAEHEAKWNGGDAITDLSVHSSNASWPRASSHFGSGIITFEFSCIFRTEPGFNLWVSGPANAPKDGVYPPTGIVESDWIPYTFTMNWCVTRPDFTLRFRSGEPLCVIYPIERHLIERVEPEMRPISDEPGLEVSYQQFLQNRAEFVTRSASINASDREKWQKHYYRGIMPDGGIGQQEHQTKLTLSPFKDPTKRDLAEHQPLDFPKYDELSEDSDPYPK
jgi:hypothetical protein